MVTESDGFVKPLLLQKSTSHLPPAFNLNVQSSREGPKIFTLHEHIEKAHNPFKHVCTRCDERFPTKLKEEEHECALRDFPSYSEWLVAINELKHQVQIVAENLKTMIDDKNKKTE